MSLTPQEIATACQQASEELNTYFNEGYYFDSLSVIKKPLIGEDLRLTYNLYAAPEDFNNKACATFNDTVRQLSKTKEWYGYRGECFKDETSLMKKLSKNKYKGGWFIPTFNMLKKLYEQRNNAFFNNSFSTKYIHYFNKYPTSYWSCTRSLCNEKGKALDFFDSENNYWSIKNLKFNTRPVRAVLVNKEEISKGPKPCP